MSAATWFDSIRFPFDVREKTLYAYASSGLLTLVGIPPQGAPGHPVCAQLSGGLVKGNDANSMREALMRFKIRTSAVPALLLAGLLSAILAGCNGTRGGPIPYNVSDFGRADPLSASVLPADYQIAPMDTLSVKLFGDETVTGDYVVDLLGNISVPLIGDIHAAGLTPQQFRNALAKKLGEKYYNHPDVTIAMKSSAGRNVTVDGAVSHAGAVSAIGSTSLMQAIALAGGTTEDANAHRVAIFRTIDGKRQAAAFDLISIRRGEMADPPVYPGDVVVVDGSTINATLKRVFMTVPLLRIFTPVIF